MPITRAHNKCTQPHVLPRHPRGCLPPSCPHRHPHSRPPRCHPPPRHRRSPLLQPHRVEKTSRLCPQCLRMYPRNVPGYLFCLSLFLRHPSSQQTRTTHNRHRRHRHPPHPANPCRLYSIVPTARFLSNTTYPTQHSNCCYDPHFSLQGRAPRMSHRLSCHLSRCTPRWTQLRNASATCVGSRSL